MATFITDIGLLVTASVDWIGDMVGAITANPLLLLFTLFGFIGTGIGLIKRMIG